MRRKFYWLHVVYEDGRQEYFTKGFKKLKDTIAFFDTIKSNVVDAGILEYKNEYNTRSWHWNIEYGNGEWYLII